MSTFLTYLFALGIVAPVQPAPTAQMLVSTAELAALLNDPRVVVLHVADRASVFEDGHIPGARFVRYADFAVQADGLDTELPPADVAKRVFEAAGVSDDSRVVIAAASPVQASRAFFTLDAFGHRQVALLDGGLRAWTAEGRPLEKGVTPPPAKASFTPRLNAARLATAQALQQQLDAGAIAVIDVRPDAEFLGTDGGMGGMHAAGHVPGAQQLTWNSLVGPDGRFLPRDQLQAKFAAAGAQQSKPVVAYCMVGMRASVVYFVARHLGYDARLYDGSIQDWTRQKLPVKAGRD